MRGDVTYFLILGLPPYVGTDEARNYKFGMRIEHEV